MSLEGPVLVVGAGLLGTSIALALRAAGVDVALRDVSEENLRIATGLGAANLDADAVHPAAGGRRGPAGPPRRAGHRGAARHRRRRHRRGQRQGRPARRGPPAGGRCPARPLRRQPPDGRQRALRPLRRLRGALRRPALGGHPARRRRARQHRGGHRLARPAGRRRSRSAPTSTTRRSPAPPTCRTCWPRWSPAGSPTPRASTWRCRARASGTSPGSPPATRRCGSRSSPPTPRRCTGCCATSASDAGRPAARASPTATGADRPGAGPRRGGHRGDPRQARRPGRWRSVGLRRRPRPPRRAGPAVRGRRRHRRQHRGRPHRPRPRPPGRAGRAERRRRTAPSTCWPLEDRGWVTPPVDSGCRRRASRSERQEAGVCGRNVVVAMDGPSGSGKSSTSRGVATRLGLRYLDTGAMFRAMTWWMLEHGVDIEDAAAVAAPPRSRHGLGHRPAGADHHGRRRRRRRADPRQRGHRRGSAGQRRARRSASGCSSCSATIIGDGGIVVEGRDIGTVVAPDADVKVFLTADPAARAAPPRRRGGRRRRRRHRGRLPAATRSTPAGRPRRWRWPTARCTSTPRRTRSRRSSTRSSRWWRPGRTRID